MALNVIFTDEATDTFESIEQQLQVRWGEKEVNEFRKHTYAVVNIVSKLPLIFQSVKNTTNIRKAFIHKNCSMFYRVTDSYIEILFFWDNRQDPLIL